MIMSKPTIAIITTNYNTWDLTQKCVEQCYVHDRGNFRSLLVYDDCSPVEFSGTFPEGVQLHRGRPNVGLTKSLNNAVRLISDDIIVLFDSDAYPTTSFCSEVRDMFERDSALGLIAFRTI